MFHESIISSLLTKCLRRLVLVRGRSLKIPAIVK